MVGRAISVALLLVGCGRVGFTPADASAAGTDAGVAGEDIVLPAGWQAEVWADFSASYSYVDVQYLDEEIEFNNRPHHMALLSAPFSPGIALVATWDIFEVHAPDRFVRHTYYPGTENGTGPDALSDADPCDTWMGSAPGLCVAAASKNGGDGIYRIEADWSITRISNDNNVGDLAYDAAGLFDGTGTPAVYWGDPNGLRRFGGTTFYQGMLNGAFTQVLPTGQLLLSNLDTATGERRLVLVASNTHAETVVRSSSVAGEPIARQHAGVFAVVAGDIARLPGAGYAIADSRDLLEVAADGTSTVIASAGSGWRWTHALVPPVGHPLAAGGWVLYILELEPAREINRIIRLRPP